MKVSNDSSMFGKIDAGELINENGKYGAIQKVSQQFEAQFLQIVLKQMRSASDVLADKDSVLSSQNDGMYRDWYDAEIASKLSQTQTRGLADVMARQLAGNIKEADHSVVMDSSTTLAMQPSLINLSVNKVTK